MGNITSLSEAFSEIGLTNTEGKILESLIVNGSSMGSEIAGKLGIHKSVAYFVLEQLVQKGLATSVVINKKREYRPIDPETLKIKLGDRKRKFSKNLDNIQSLLQVVQKKRKRTLFNIFEGWDGMKIAFSDIIKTMVPEEEYYVFAVDVPERFFPKFRRFIGNFHAVRIEKGIRCKLLMTSRMRSTLGAERMKEPHTSVRFVSSEYSMPMAANVYADKVLITIFADSPLAIIIESKEASNSFKAFFHLLWKLGER